MFKYKKGDKVWANTDQGSLPWRKGCILRGHRKADNEIIYNFMPNIGRYGFEVPEKDIKIA